MDNETRRPRKKVTKKVAQRRRLIALAVIFLLLVLIIVLICNACSSDDDPKGNKKTPAATTTVTTTMNTFTPVVTTTTTAPVPTTDPNDPNTITKITLDKYVMNLEIGEVDMAWVTMEPSSSTELGEIWSSSDENVAVVNEWGNVTAIGGGECIITVKSQNNPIVYAEIKVTVTDPNGTVSGAGQTTTAVSGASANAAQTNNLGTNIGGISQTATTTNSQAAPVSNGSANVVTENGMSYVNGILIANKSYSLPSDYNPGGLTPETQSAFDKMAAAAANDGLELWVCSGFRSYDYQATLYDSYANDYGKETADTFSARPGYSEHQTGLAIDVNYADDSFAETPEAAWLAENCYKYGFIIRYPKGKEAITGYQYESWHVRYLGVETATAVYNSGLTLEEYLGVDSFYH